MAGIFLSGGRVVGEMIDVLRNRGQKDFVALVECDL